MTHHLRKLDKKRVPETVKFSYSFWYKLVRAAGCSRRKMTPWSHFELEHMTSYQEIRTARQLMRIHLKDNAKFHPDPI